MSLDRILDQSTALPPIPPPHPPLPNADNDDDEEEEAEEEASNHVRAENADQTVDEVMVEEMETELMPITLNETVTDDDRSGGLPMPEGPNQLGTSSPATAASERGATSIRMPMFTVPENVSCVPADGSAPTRRVVRRTVVYALNKTDARIDRHTKFLRKLLRKRATISVAARSNAVLTEMYKCIQMVERNDLHELDAQIDEVEQASQDFVTDCRKSATRRNKINHLTARDVVDILDQSERRQQQQEDEEGGDDDASEEADDESDEAPPPPSSRPRRPLRRRGPPPKRAAFAALRARFDLPPVHRRLRVSGKRKRRPPKRLVEQEPNRPRSRAKLLLLSPPPPPPRQQRQQPEAAPEPPPSAPAREEAVSEATPPPPKRQRMGTGFAWTTQDVDTLRQLLIEYAPKVLGAKPSMNLNDMFAAIGPKLGRTKLSIAHFTTRHGFHMRFPTDPQLRAALREAGFSTALWDK